MGRRAQRREDSAARLRALTRRAYTASSGHLDLDDPGREFDRIVRGDPDDDAAPRPTSPPTRRWAVSVRAAVVVLAVVAALAGIIVVRSLPLGSVPVAVPELQAPELQAPEPGEDSDAGASGDGFEGTGGPDGHPGEGGRSGESPTPAMLTVHVAGAVAAPGIVELPDGARVAQAVEAAGGAVADAELAAVNLARPLQDGEQVYVPTVGEAPPGAAAGPAGPGLPRASPEGGGADPVVDLNTADAAQLETLPGVGPAIAQRILDWRDTHGSFHTVEELLEVSGIGPATLERIRDRVRT